MVRIYSVMEIEGNYARSLGSYVEDPARAHQHARTTQCLVTVQAVHIVADYREEPTHDQ
jgi:hypothetical protein